MYDYVHGHTHRCDKKETRGRGKSLIGADVLKLLQARRRLIKQADNDTQVRYSDIIAAAIVTVCQYSLLCSTRNDPDFCSKTKRKRNRT